MEMENLSVNLKSMNKIILVLFFVLFIFSDFYSQADNKLIKSILKDINKDRVEEGQKKYAALSNTYTDLSEKQRALKNYLNVYFGRLNHRSFSPKECLKFIEDLKRYQAEYNYLSERKRKIFKRKYNINGEFYNDVLIGIKCLSEDTVPMAQPKKIDLNKLIAEARRSEAELIGKVKADLNAFKTALGGVYQVDVEISVYDSTLKASLSFSADTTAGMGVGEYHSVILEKAIQKFINSFYSNKNTPNVSLRFDIEGNADARPLRPNRLRYNGCMGPTIDEADICLRRAAKINECESRKRYQFSNGQTIVSNDELAFLRAYLALKTIKSILVTKPEQAIINCEVIDNSSVKTNLYPKHRSVKITAYMFNYLSNPK